MKIDQETLYKALGQVVAAIEDCGASEKLTSAVILASELQQAVGNQYNPPKDYAVKNVIERTSEG